MNARDTPAPGSAPAHANVLVVGAGSAGCVVANRLSADPACRVLLLEAGPRAARGDAAAAVRNGNQPAVVPGLNWKYRTAIKGNLSSPVPGRASGTAFDYEAGRLVGGSSAVNATQALRGAPADYDEWAQDCGPAWSWEAVLPVFRALEDDPLGPNPWHGRGGPMPIRREALAALTPLQAALMQACVDAGQPSTADLNDPSTEGVGVIPRNVVDGMRISAAMAFLDPVRRRPNLDVRAGVHVHRLLWAGAGVCRGVSVDIDGQPMDITADTVVLCGGVMSTPAVLMRSGVGDPQVLRGLGLAVSLPLSGVGENLMEHPVVGIWGVPVAGASRLGEPLRQTLLRWTSGCSGHLQDTHISMMAGMDAREMFPHLAAADNSVTLAGVTACFNKSVSRGRVLLTSTDPHAPPRVSNNCLGDSSDVAPLKAAVRMAWQLMHQPVLRSRFDRLLAWTDGMVRSDAALEQAVRAFVRPAAHACGTARMGRSPDRGAVVDPQGRLHGARNVHVADASVMPRIPSAPPHLSCLMVAHKIADGIRGVP